LKGLEGYPDRPRVSFSLSTGGGEDEELLYEVRFVDWLEERVLDEVSIEPGLLRNTCSSGIRDKDMKASSPYIFFFFFSQREGSWGKGLKS
jgi:hypothetical protein